ncbi:MAG: TetR family transcriptional regulator [Methyloprofundus sp.]|nr:TetR family transcriptional regulator [Methyloprofundus sp.]
MKQGEQTRSNIIKSANKLFYQQGFHKTAFSDIVQEVGLSKGNITYHFKSKEDILTAVFKQRIENTKNTLAAWDQKYPDASARLHCFIDSLVAGKSELTRYGCPNATLATELGKSDALTRELSLGIFDLIRNWLSRQFLDLGYTPEQAENLAMELFISGQGICVLSQVYSDENMFEHEVIKLKKMIKQN